MLKTGEGNLFHMSLIGHSFTARLFKTIEELHAGPY